MLKNPILVASLILAAAIVFATWYPEYVKERNIQECIEAFMEAGRAYPTVSLSRRDGRVSCIQSLYAGD